MTKRFFVSASTAVLGPNFYGTGLVSDMKIYEDQFFSGMAEVLQQNVDAFNASSQGAITLTTEYMRGNFDQQSFFQKPAGLIGHRDPTSMAGLTDLALTQGEFKGVKVNKRIGPVSNSFDSFKKIGSSIDEMSFILGQQTAPDIQAQYLTSAISALTGTFKVAGVASNLVYSALSDSTKTLNHLALVKTLAKFGDAAQNIKLWVMHSKNYYDLVGQAITDKLLEVTAGTIYGGSPGTLGRPVLVTDVDALFSNNATTSTTADDFYWVLGLTANAVNIRESEERSMIIQPITGAANLAVRYQGEFSYNVDVKGMAFGTQVNPTDAQLSTSSNWTQAAASKKSLPGVALKVQ